MINRLRLLSKKVVSTNKVATWGDHIAIYLSIKRTILLMTLFAPALGINRGACNKPLTLETRHYDKCTTPKFITLAVTIGHFSARSK